MTRRVRGLAVRGDDERLLKGCGATVDNARAHDSVPLEFDGQSLEKGVALHWVDRRGGGLNGNEFGI
jgi:hypothetical protein